MKKYMVLLSLLALGFLAGCGRERAALPVAARPFPVPEVFVHEPPPGNPEPIPVARGQRKPGDAILLQGRIMGVPHPFTDEWAAFVLGDENTLTPCNQRTGDGCPTPWDVCCDAPEARRAGVATIQVLGPNGVVVRQGLKGVHGLQELSRVCVVGAVAHESTPEALVVNATAIYIMNDKPAPEAPCCTNH